VRYILLVVALVLIATPVTSAEQGEVELAALDEVSPASGARPHRDTFYDTGRSADPKDKKKPAAATKDAGPATPVPSKAGVPKGKPSELIIPEVAPEPEVEPETAPKPEPTPAPEKVPGKKATPSDS